MRRVGFIVILGLLVVGASQPTLGQTTQYSVTNLGFVSGNSLNDKGQVAGCKSSFSLATTPFVWDAANGVQDIGIPPGFTSASATGINNLGHVAGEASVGPGTFPGLFYWDSTKGFLLPGFSVQSSSSISDTDLIALIPSNAPAFLWGPVSGAQPLQVPCPGLESGVKDISSSGAFVVGFAAVRLPTCDSSGPFNDVAVMWSAGSSTQLTVFGAWGVNNLGQVVGNVCQPSGFSPCHAAVWTKNVLQDIGLLAGDLNAVAYGINDAGQVVGDSAGSFSYRAFVWDSKNGMRDLNSLIPAGSGI